MEPIKSLVKKTPLWPVVVKLRRFQWSSQKQWRNYRKRQRALAEYQQDWRAYERLSGENLPKEEAFPCLDDRTSTTSIEPHYFYQGIWAARAIQQSGTTQHIDVGSSVMCVTMLTPFTQVIFIDIRPLPVTLANFESKAGNILAMPFEDNSVESLSCLHVAEHIGLGRYGDELDPLGTQKATKELARVLAPGGNLYFSLPIGRPRICFNAHRIHSTAQIMGYFQGLKLVNFSAVDDKGAYIPSADLDAFSQAGWSCGLFQFTKI